MNDASSSAAQPNALPAGAAPNHATQAVALPVTHPVLAPLNTDDWGLLTRLERQLGSGKTPMPTAASALATIKRKGLARFHGLSFGEYCAQRLRLKRSRVHQLLEFADLIEVTSKSGPLSQIGNERQLRPLKKLPREDWATAWSEAVRTAPCGKVSGKHVQAVVDARLAQMQAAQVPTPAPAAVEPPAQAIAPAPIPAIQCATMAIPSTTPTPTSGADGLIRTVPAADVAMPGWPETWVKAARSLARPASSFRSGVFGWQPAD